MALVKYTPITEMAERKEGSLRIAIVRRNTWFSIVHHRHDAATNKIPHIHTYLAVFNNRSRQSGYSKEAINYSRLRK
jgi:hypothetical protein